MASPDLIVGLGHKKRVGKDTFARFLTQELECLGYEVFRFAFADAMKEAAAKMFGERGLKSAHFYDAYPEYREWGLYQINKTPRQIWIEFGNALRGIDPEIWIRKLERLMIAASISSVSGKRPVAFIITDVRFLNEAEAVRRWGGKLIEVRREDAPKGTDPAEVALDSFGGWDYYVNNNGSLHDLSGIASCAADFLHNKPNWKGN